MRQFDVIVCGGGPAGLAAAIACRMRGLSTVLLDCAHPPIDKACGEGLLPEALSALVQLGVEQGSIPGFPFQGIAFIDGDALPVRGRFRNGPARGVRRTHLHEALCRRAQQVGVDLRWGTYITSLEERADAVDISIRSGSLRAAWCIGADGLQSHVRRWSGLERGRSSRTRIGLRAHYSIPPWSEFTEVYWGSLGQIYVTPTGPGEISLAVLADVRPVCLDAFIDDFPRLRQMLAGAAPTSAARGAVTFSRRLSRVATRRIALLGDASGSVDAITGAGLSLAFQQALAISSAIRDGNLGGYEGAQREICRTASLTSSLLLHLDRFPALRALAFASFRRKPGLFERMLALHTGAAPFSYWGSNGALTLGLQTLLG